jgi:hypothetical protein
VAKSSQGPVVTHFEFCRAEFGVKLFLKSEGDAAIICSYGYSSLPSGKSTLGARPLLVIGGGGHER